MESLQAMFAQLHDLDHIAVAVSGGADSLALMYLLASWRQEIGSQVRLSVLTVNHGLRPEAVDEALFVQDCATQLGLPHYILHESGERPISGLQEWARALRYRLMVQWCCVHKASDLLTAHHQEDQAETLLMRLKRGAGPEGLAGIYPEMMSQGIVIRRPFLNVSKQVLRDFLQAKGQKWIEDPSNKNDSFERVRWRALQKQLQDNGMRADALARSAEKARLASQALDWAVKRLLREVVHHQEAGFAAINKQAFFLHPSGLTLRALSILMASYGAHNSTAAHHDLLRLEHWLKSAEDVGKGRTLGGARFHKRRDEFLVGREAGRIDHVALTLEPHKELIWDKRFVLCYKGGQEVSVMASGQVADVPRCKDLPAFVQASLPVACSKGQFIALPSFQQDHIFCARFCLPSWII